MNPAFYLPASGNYDETSPSGITLTSGIIPEVDAFSLSFNTTSGEFLQYSFYDSNTEEVRVKTLSVPGGAPPSLLSRQLFLAIPDWEEHDDNDLTYNLFLHGTDNNTLFYLRRHGISGQNTLKAGDTDGNLLATGAFFSAAANFTTGEVKVGDSIEIATIGSRRVDQVVDSNNLIVTPSGDTGTGLTYNIYSNAEMRQFNTDPSLSATAAVNVDDFSLRAGTTDTTTVRAEVINAWGDPLLGKTVDFSVTQGDGVVAPASDATDAAGEATTTYTVGSTPGAVRITAVVSD